jgi:bifunctional non-homologous end joining protein LigD
VLSGSRVRGRYALFQTDGKNWMIHRMDPPEEAWDPLPELVRPMPARPTDRLPADDEAWGFELWWAGARAVAYVSGGRLRLLDAGDRDVTGGYPELRALAETLAPTECVLDGVVVAFDADGRVSQDALRPRAEVDDPQWARRLAPRIPVQYLVFDLLWLDGRSTMDLPYVERRALLEGLGLAGAHWQTPPYFPAGGRFALETSREQGLPGVVAKRLDSPYRPGKSTRDWLAVRPRTRRTAS